VRKRKRITFSGVFVQFERAGTLNTAAFTVTVR
jgi:hypothetical protein